MARDILNNVPTGWLLVAATVVAIGIVLLTVLVILRLVPATREGHHVEISAPMHGVVAALFGLFLAFCHHQNYLSAGTNISGESESLSALVRDSAAFPEPECAGVRSSVGT